MKQRLKQYLLIGLAATVFYFILDNHYIVDGREIHLFPASQRRHREFF